jgi:hypothetical protein
MAKRAGSLVAKDIGQLIDQHALASRSPLYRWMHANYRYLKPSLTRPRPSWSAVAKAAGDAGQKNAMGENYSRQILWKTWHQLHRDMEAIPPPKPNKPRARPPDSALPATAPTASLATEPPKGITPDARHKSSGRDFVFEAPTKARDRNRLIGGGKADK